MKIIFYQIGDAIKEMIKSFFVSDLDVMSEEVKEILSNPEDAEKYKKAVEEIKGGKQTSTVLLSNNKEITLVQ